ncbi:hypothetical protein ACFS07_07405 [Undibacterium arcticum]
MAAWHSQDWRIRAGYQYQTINRSEVDDIIVSRGNTPYKHNHVLIGDVSYHAFKNTIVFLRGQYMANQFNGEVPLAYNSLTADRFNQRYGLVSTGLIFFTFLRVSLLIGLSFQPFGGLRPELAEGLERLGF